MSSSPRDLVRLQRWFQDRTLNGPVKDAGREILPSRTLEPNERLEIYSGMFPLRMREALNADFPAVRALLGGDGFERLVRAYVKKHPSRHPSLNHLGDHLPRFLGGTARVPRKALVRDVARLELAMTEVFDEKRAEPLDSKGLAKVPPEAWTRVTWREGSRGHQTSRFAAARVRAARGYDITAGTVTHVHDEEWLLVHWPDDEPEPTKAWLSNLPKDTPLLRLVQLARLRWRIERDHQEGKELLGLDHYEGRSWHGLHHHLALVLLAQQFLALERWTEQKKAQLAAPPAEPAPPPPEAFSPSFTAALLLRHRRAPARSHRPAPVPVLPDVPASH